jgi:olefin beta-lactone synthetase
VNLAQFLDNPVREQGDAPALIDTAGETLSFSALADRSGRVATLLATRGIGTASQVLLFIPISVDLYTTLIAVLRLGATVVIVDPHQGLDHVGRCCEIAAPDAMIAVPRAHWLRLRSAAVRKIRRHFSTRRMWPLATSLGAARHCEPMPGITPRGPDDPAILSFTSGSTGTPKCAVRTHGLLCAQYQALRETLSLAPGDVDFATLPIFTLANLAAGVTTVIGDFAHPAVNRVTAAPKFFSARGETDPRIRRVFTGGGPVFPSLLRRLAATYPQASITSLYGSTEAEPSAHVSVGETSADDLTAMQNGKGLLAGHPVSQVRLRILRSDHSTPKDVISQAEFDASSLGQGQIGEIVVSGDHVLKGYLNGRGDSQTKMRVGDVVWHRTGDAGYLDAKGRLWLVGRLAGRVADDLGELYPLQVEAMVDGLPGIRRCALAPDVPGRMLLVEADDGAFRDVLPDLRRRCDTLGLVRIARVDAIPMDARHGSKIDYDRLRKLARELGKE